MRSSSQLLGERFRGIAEEPALLGVMLASGYALASLAQVALRRPRKVRRLGAR